MNKTNLKASLALAVAAALTGCKVEVGSQAAADLQKLLDANTQSPAMAMSREKGRMCEHNGGSVFEGRGHHDHEGRDHDHHHEHEHEGDEHEDDEHEHHGGGTTQSGPSNPENCFVERFQQPEEQYSQSVDILFVADTSGSMRDNRRKVAEGLSSFIHELPSGSNYRVAMMLAHGSSSANSGKLWSLPGKSPVLDSAAMSSSRLRSQLSEMMEEASDSREQGEMGMYSLLQGLSAEKLAESRAKGFFRSNAALAVVFISDENDICAIYPQSAGSNTGLTSSERLIRTRDCANGIQGQAVVDAVRQVQGDKPFTFGAVVNTNRSRSYSGGESYGWGYLDVVMQSQGIAVDIRDSHFDDGLARIGSLVTRSLNLVTSFQLQHSPVIPESIRIFVDRVAHNGTFVVSSNEVHLNYAGRANSDIEVRYCVQPPTDPGTGTGGGTNPTDPGTGTGGGTNPTDPGTGTGGGTNPTDPGTGTGGGTNPTDPGTGTGGGTNPTDPNAPCQGLECGVIPGVGI